MMTTRTSDTQTQASSQDTQPAGCHTGSLEERISQTQLSLLSHSDRLARRKAFVCAGVCASPRQSARAQRLGEAMARVAAGWHGGAEGAVPVAVV